MSNSLRTGFDRSVKLPGPVHVYRPNRKGTLVEVPFKVVHKAAPKSNRKHLKLGEPKLVYTTSRKPVKVGDKANTFHGDLVSVVAFREPHKAESSGKVTIQHMNGFTAEYYVGVIGAEWINRTDR